MSLFCLLPPTILALSLLFTQTSNQYEDSLKAVLAVIEVGLLTTIFFIPYGMMISSLTKRRSFAIIGTFASFFVLTIISDIFSHYNDNWFLLSPLNLFWISVSKIFDMPIGIDISNNIYYATMVSMIVLPMLVLYINVNRKAVGK